MNGVIFIGDELTASGFRLAGCETATPEFSDVPGLFLSALKSHAVIMVGASYAGKLDPEALEASQRSQIPLVNIVPEIGGKVHPPDLEGKIRRILGIES